MAKRRQVEAPANIPVAQSDLGIRVPGSILLTSLLRTTALPISIPQITRVERSSRPIPMKRSSLDRCSRTIGPGTGGHLAALPPGCSYSTVGFPTTRLWTLSRMGLCEDMGRGSLGWCGQQLQSKFKQTGAHLW